jgi:DNA-binding beta-propeller fold protein YncE
LSLLRSHEACLCVAFAIGAAACSKDPKLVDIDYAGDAFPDRRPRIERAGRRLAYVPNRSSDTISVLDLNQMTVVTTPPVGRDPVDIDGPRHVVIDPDADLAYVVLSYPESRPGAHEAAQGATARFGYVEALDLRDLGVAGDVRVDPVATELAISSATGVLGVVHLDESLATLNAADPEARRAALMLVDAPREIPSGDATPRRTRVCAAPSALAFNADGSRVFVACIGEDAIAVVDAASGEVLSRVPSGTSPANRPYALTADPVRERLLVSNQVSNAVVVFDMTDAPSSLTTFLVSARPMFATWLDDTRVAVPHQEPDGVSVFDVETSELLLDVPYAAADCKLPAELTLTSDARLLLVCEGDHYTPGAVVELDPESLAIQSRVEVGLYPERLTLLDP